MRFVTREQVGGVVMLENSAYDKELTNAMCLGKAKGGKSRQAAAKPCHIAGTSCYCCLLPYSSVMYVSDVMTAGRRIFGICKSTGLFDRDV